MRLNNFNIGDVVMITSKFRVVGINIDRSGDIYYELMPYEGAPNINLHIDEDRIRGVSGKYIWNKEE